MASLLASLPIPPTDDLHRSSPTIPFSDPPLRFYSSFQTGEPQSFERVSGSSEGFQRLPKGFQNLQKGFHSLQMEFHSLPKLGGTFPNAADREAQSVDRNRGYVMHSTPFLHLIDVCPSPRHDLDSQKWQIAQRNECRGCNPQDHGFNSRNCMYISV